MIISQTPLRISFLGGGTDFPEFFEREGGSVLSAAIDKYIYVIVKERFDERIRVGYTRTELVDSLDDLEHELVREALRITGVTRKVEIATMGDIPSQGSGLGSSSTVTVGLLNALHSFRGTPQEASSLAALACRIEVDILGKPIGIQDQYAVAFGGLNFLTFCDGNGVTVEPVRMEPASLAQLNRNLLLFYTNKTRRSESVLAGQKANLSRSVGILREIKQLSVEGRQCLEKGELGRFGRLMGRGWALKKKLAWKISNPLIDALYERAVEAGALGGKITGAGGGGFLLLYGPEECHSRVRAALSGFPELPFSLASEGSQIIFDNQA